MRIKRIKNEGYYHLYASDAEGADFIGRYAASYREKLYLWLEGVRERRIREAPVRLQCEAQDGRAGHRDMQKPG